VIVLIVVTVTSIVTLFLRGFKFRDIENQVFGQEIKTPIMKVWLIEKAGYGNKMAAFKAGIGAAQSGLGVCVIKTDNQWRWVAGVYKTYDEAQKALSMNSVALNLSIREYKIESKNFKISRDAVFLCQNVLDSAVSVFEILLTLRDNVEEKLSTENLIMKLTTEYNQIKDNIQKLQDINATLKSPLVASVIYIGNQNILSLQKIICGNNSYNLADLNTVLLNTLFSLDNF